MIFIIVFVYNIFLGTKIYVSGKVGFPKANVKTKYNYGGDSYH